MSTDSSAESSAEPGPDVQTGPDSDSIRDGAPKQPDTGSDLPARPPRQLSTARKVADILDRSIKVPGTDLRFGLDPILGLLPVGGDVLAALGSGYVIYVAWRNGAPGSMIGRMLANVLFDTVVGSVPVVGDLFDAGWKANTRNVRLLEEWVGEEGRQRHHSVAILVGIIAALLGLLGLVTWLGWLLMRTLFGGL